jgi:hypothetical protein
VHGHAKSKLNMWQRRKLLIDMPMYFRLFSGLRSYTEVLQLGASLQQQLASLTRCSSPLVARIGHCPEFRCILLY